VQLVFPTSFESLVVDLKITDVVPQNYGQISCSSFSFCFTCWGVCFALSDLSHSSRSLSLVFHLANTTSCTIYMIVQDGINLIAHLEKMQHLHCWPASWPLLLTIVHWDITIIAIEESLLDWRLTFLLVNNHLSLNSQSSNLYSWPPH
jgi:hypothetical protein